MNPAVIHLAAWLCSRVKIISRLNGDVALLKPGFQASGAVCAVSADQAVRATDVMVNASDIRVQKSRPERRLFFEPPNVSSVLG